MPVAAPPATDVHPLAGRVASLRDEYAARWERTPPRLPPLGDPAGWWRHVTNARAARLLMDGLASQACNVPADTNQRQAWRDQVRERLQQFGASRLGWPAGYRRLVFGDAFFTASTDFARQARVFDPDLPLGDLWQALRNVWIGNSLQMLLERPVRLTGSLFAYSMLYPLTDNRLDDTTVSPAAKRAFNERFGRRLAGARVCPEGAAEAAVFRLIETVEEEYPRDRFGDVHQSLLAIHAGQVKSVTQQDDPNLSDARLLSISCEKGGSSVLADLYLVAGAASPDEERFAFGYGVALQLMDDLQDVEHDRAAGHQTVFTRAASRGPLDEPAARLLHFIDGVLDDGPCFAGPAFADRKDLLRRNCRSLVVGSMAEHPWRFTRGFRRRVAVQWPFALPAMRRLRRRAQRRFADAERELRRQTGARSLLDWLLSQNDVTAGPYLRAEAVDAAPSTV